MHSAESTKSPGIVLDTPETPLAKDTQLDLLHRMKLIRTVEETIAERYAEQKMRCPTHLSVGQEAVASGVCAALSCQDQAFSGHRAHAHYLAKGGSLEAMIAEIYGKATGCSGGKGGSMHLVDLAAGFLGSTAIVGGTIPLAVGTALSNKVLANGQVSCAFFGDAAVEEGVFFESVNFAVVKQLPVLFVCENNLYSVYSPLSVRQPPDRSIAKMVSCLGLPVLDGDGNNVETVHRMTVAARSHVLKSGGPVFLEFFTYRWREHCGPNFDNDIGYRSEEEFNDWQTRDPLAAYEQLLLSREIVSEDELSTMTDTINRLTSEAFTFAEQSPDPELGETLRHVYADARDSESSA